MATTTPTPVIVSPQATGSVAGGDVRAMTGLAEAKGNQVGESKVAEESDHSLVHTTNTNELGLQSLKNSFQPGSPITRLPVELGVAVPVRDFRVRNLLNLAPGQLVETQWVHGDDLPLSSGDVQMAWTEFEVVDTRLAVRITRLA
jgi:flagellar motor switch/type III secretory pathway protein FliN